MTRHLSDLVVVALPGSGKTELLRFLKQIQPQYGRELGLGPVIELDDYPYVEMMRGVDEALTEVGKEQVFFSAMDQPFRDPRSWLTLIAMLNEDFASIGTGFKPNKHPAVFLLERLQTAAAQTGAEGVLDMLGDNVGEILPRLEPLARRIVNRLEEVVYATPPEGATVILEFARGGSVDASMPLSFPIGYKHSFGMLSDAILKEAAFLYVQVNPKQSFAKNAARGPKDGEPFDPRVHHCVPPEVMVKDYGLDDMEWLRGQSDRPNTIEIGDYHLPCAVLDNRTDKTTFAREDPRKWTAGDYGTLLSALRQAFAHFPAA